MRARAGSGRSLIVVVAMVATMASAGVFRTAPVGAAADPLDPLPNRATWIQTLNAWRAASELPPVAENSTWSTGAFNHSKYVVETGDFGHDEDDGGPYSTPSGITAGANGNVAASGSATKTDRAFVEQWMTAPFHAAGLLDPRLATSGFGAYRRAGATPWPAAATLDVLRGRTGAAPTSATVFPGDESTVPAAQMSYRGGESPDPLSPCPGYDTAPISTGLPLFALFPNAPPSGVTATLTRNAITVPACVYDENTYTNPDPAAQTLGRQVLASRHQVVLVPREPLKPGCLYVAEIHWATGGILWQFVAKPELSIGNTSIVEGQSSSRSARLTVSLSGQTSQPVTVSYATAPGTVVAGSDYMAKSGTVTIPPGATTAVISVPIKGDRLIEPNEAFTVKLSDPVGADLRRSSGSVSLLTDDRGSAAPAGVRMSIGSASIVEGNASIRAVRFVVSLSAVATNDVSVSYATAVGTATEGFGNDFGAASGTLVIPAGSTGGLIKVRVYGNSVVEPTEAFTVGLSGAVGAVIDRPTGTGSILNDD